ncbi:hypothetical protein BLNAU_1752 [Blattamonas nauphoetae]|uniref:Polymerase nucleotidyl transferase domain-containing protein n=1 Tax=Blattamonas nauphoetae TaxID=2049346 RepID=A0ABQ9YHI7_9EUKA|nr:hypothetical protein BLNAU_1752 [Blattamonas nauphoetae]
MNHRLSFLNWLNSSFQIQLEQSRFPPFSGIQCMMFGSSFTGLGTKDCDIDIYCNCGIQFSSNDGNLDLDSLSKLLNLEETQETVESKKSSQIVSSDADFSIDPTFLALPELGQTITTRPSFIVDKTESDDSTPEESDSDDITFNTPDVTRSAIQPESPVAGSASPFPPPTPSPNRIEKHTPDHDLALHSLETLQFLLSKSLSSFAKSQLVERLTQQHSDAIAPNGKLSLDKLNQKDTKEFHMVSDLKFWQKQIHLIPARVPILRFTPPPPFSIPSTDRPKERKITKSATDQIKAFFSSFKTHYTTNTSSDPPLPSISQCDIVISGPDGVASSAAILNLFDSPPEEDIHGTGLLLREYLFIIKLWAKKRGVSDAAQGFPSAYMICVMGLHWIRVWEEWKRRRREKKIRKMEKKEKKKKNEDATTTEEPASKTASDQQPNEPPASDTIRFYLSVLVYGFFFYFGWVHEYVNRPDLPNQQNYADGRGVNWQTLQTTIMSDLNSSRGRNGEKLKNDEAPLYYFSHKVTQHRYQPTALLLLHHDRARFSSSIGSLIPSIDTVCVQKGTLIRSVDGYQLSAFVSECRRAENMIRRQLQLDSPPQITMTKQPLEWREFGDYINTIHQVCLMNESTFRQIRKILTMNPFEILDQTLHPTPLVDFVNSVLFGSSF